MNTALASRLLMIPLLSLLMAAAVLVDPAPVNAPAALSSKDVGMILRKTLIMRDWSIDSDTGSEIVATLHLRSHALKVKFTHHDHQIGMKYLDSENLDYRVKKDGTRLIHKKYGAWMQNLANAFHQNFQMALLARTG
jgi:hypothetical protein